MDQKVLDRIRKLLALATSPVEAEARSAAEKANELLIRHNLKMQDIPAHEKVYDDLIAINKSKLSTEDDFIFGILIQHFFVDVIRDYNLRRAGQGTRVHFVGEQTNIQVAMYIYGFLHDAYRKLWHALKEKHKLPLRAKKAYYVGLTDGINEQLTVKRRSVESETGLMVVTDVNIAKYVKDTIGKTRVIPSGKYLNFREAQDAGYEDGKNLKIRRGIEDQGTEKDLYLEHVT